MLIRDRDSKFTACLRRGLHRRRHPHQPHPGPCTKSERHRGTLDRHPAPRMPRPPPDHRTAPPRGCAAGVHRALQHAPPAPISRPAPTRLSAGGPHSPAFRRDHPAAATIPARRPSARVRAGRMTRQGSRHPHLPHRARGRQRHPAHLDHVAVLAVRWARGAEWTWRLRRNSRDRGRTSRRSTPPSPAEPRGPGQALRQAVDSQKCGPEGDWIRVWSWRMTVRTGDGG
jgi:hypothetical protein